MIQVRMRQKHFQPVSLKIFANAAHSAAGIKHDADLRQQQAGRVPPTIGKITAGAE
jgi:hypothetical protein